MAGLWLHVMRASQGPWRQPCVRWLKPSLAQWPFPLGRPRWTDRLSSVPGLWWTAPRRLPGASPQAAIGNMVRALWAPPPPRAPLLVPNKGTALGSSVPEAGTCPGRGNVGIPTRPSLQAHPGLTLPPLGRQLGPCACRLPSSGSASPLPLTGAHTLLPVQVVCVLFSVTAN